MQVSEKIQRKSANKMEVPGFYNLIPRATSHHFRQMLCIRSELLGPVRSQRKGGSQGHE